MASTVTVTELPLASLTRGSLGFYETVWVNRNMSISFESRDDEDSIEGYNNYTLEFESLEDLIHKVTNPASGMMSYSIGLRVLVDPQYGEIQELLKRISRGFLRDNPLPEIRLIGNIIDLHVSPTVSISMSKNGSVCLYWDETEEVQPLLFGLYYNLDEALTDERYTRYFTPEVVRTLIQAHRKLNGWA